MIIQIRLQCLCRLYVKKYLHCQCVACIFCIHIYGSVMATHIILYLCLMYNTDLLTILHKFCIFLNGNSHFFIHFNLLSVSINNSLLLLAITRHFIMEKRKYMTARECFQMLHLRNGMSNLFIIGSDSYKFVSRFTCVLKLKSLYFSTDVEIFV